MVDIDKVIALQKAVTAEKKAASREKHVDMFFAASRSAGRMSLEDSQKLTFAENQKEYRKKAREAGPSFQDVFVRVGGKQTLDVLKDLCKPFVDEF